jgi:predicted glycosyltransferase
MYSHDTFGLGHITRTLRLARATVEAIPDATVLVLTGSPIAHRLSFPPGVEHVKLPSVRKRGPEEYVPRELGIPFWRLRRMRVQIIRDSLRLFQPHILFVDNVPLGMKAEILPSLEFLKERGTMLHLNLRDILDEPGVVRSQWAGDGTHDILSSLYDEIHVFGDRSIHDSTKEYGLPAWKTAFHGYIAPPSPGDRGRELPTRGRNGSPSVLVTIGGGEDGADTLRCLIEAERRLASVRRVKFDIVLGPLMGLDEAEHLRASSRRGSGISVCDFVEDLADFMSEYDLVVSMGGYNTLCEVMDRAHRSLVIPRVRPRREQEIRARALEARGILRLIHPGDLTPDRFGGTISESLERGPMLPSPQAPCLEGINRFKQRLEEIAPRLVDRLPSRRKRPGGEAVRATTRAGRRFARTGIFGLEILAFLLGTAGHASASLVPKSVNTELLVGYDTNILDASDAEIQAFKTHDPESFFVVERMEDAALQMSVEGRWALATGSKSDTRLRYSRLQYLHETIRSENHYAVQLRRGLNVGTVAELSLEFSPRAYGRHRRDKDALPGDPIFRAEVREQWDGGLQIARALGPRWSSVFVVEGSIRDYDQPFNERDRWRVGGRTGFAWQMSPRARIGLSGGYRRLQSRNAPYLGSDLSYREWSARSALDWAFLGFRARAYVNRDWTHYTSSDPADENHFGRHDDEWEIGGFLQHALSGSLDWKASAAHLRRDASSAFIFTGEFDEEGSTHDTFVSTGIAWHWQR